MNKNKKELFGQDVVGLACIGLFFVLGVVGIKTAESSIPNVVAANGGDAQIQNPVTSVASLNIALDSKTIDAKAGDKGVELQSMTLKNDLNREAAIRITSFNALSSSASGYNLDAAYLYMGDTLLAKGDVSNKAKVTFDIPVAVAASGTATLVFKGDISMAAKAETLSYRMKYVPTVVSGGVATTNPVKVSGTPTVVRITASSACNLSAQIKDGSVIRLQNGIDVYIIKYVGCKQFKRHILNPSIFNLYGHLNWKKIVAVDQATLDSFTTSSYVRATKDSKIWLLSETGTRKDVTISVSSIDPDSIFEINAKELALYPQAQ